MPQQGDTREETTLSEEASPFAGRSILITGGTGSFGRRFVKTVLAEHGPRRVIIFSRDELKQYEFQQELGEDPRTRSRVLG